MDPGFILLALNLAFLFAGPILGDARHLAELRRKRLKIPYWRKRSPKTSVPVIISHR